ncbi:hypothetical protein Tco_1563245 [Tanacetum coccineum]
MADPNSPMPVARRVVDELIEVSGETEPSRYMKFFDVQQIAESRRFLNRMRDEVQTSRTCLSQLTAMISELEAMNDAGELFDTLMSLRDDKQVESNKLSLLNEMILWWRSLLLPKKTLLDLVDGSEAYVERLAY